MKVVLSILKSELIRNTSLLISGTILAQLIAILIQPLLRRIYPVSAFGMYSVYTSLIGMVSVVSSLRYDDAIVLPEKDSESINLFALSQIFNIIIVLLVTIIILFFGESILQFINIPSGLPITLLLLVPVGAWLLNISQGLNFWLIREKRFGRVTAGKLMRRSAEASSQVSFAIVKRPAGLIISDIAGQFVNVAFLFHQSLKSKFKVGHISWKKIGFVMKKYSEFPKFNLIPAFMSTYSFALPTILINKFYSVENAGFFDASKTVLSIPLAFIALSVSNVLLQKTSELFNQKKSLVCELKPVFYIILVMMIMEIALISFFGPTLFSLFFSKKYYFSGEISRILVWSFTLNFLISSFTCLFYSMRKIKLYSIWQAFYFLGIMSLVLCKDLDFKGFIKTYVIIEVVCYIVLITLMMTLVLQYENKIRIQALND
jgi:O-antigen/teichoic acid export membrane protein